MHINDISHKGELFDATCVQERISVTKIVLVDAKKLKGDFY